MHHKYPTIDIVSFMDSNFANWRLEDKFSLALLIATTAHFKQYDKGGNPYITHPMRIMMRLRTTDKELMQIAILHDVIEDTLVTFEDLKILGFSDRFISALNVLTKDNTISYEKNIDRVLTNIDACKVKLEDLKDNLDASRLKNISEKTLIKQQEYIIAFDRISKHVGKNEQIT